MSTPVPDTLPDCTTQPVEVTEAMRLKAGNCIKNHVIAAMGVGMVPNFWVQAAGVTGIEVKMIRDLAHIYNFPMPSDLVAYKVLISLIGTILPFYMAAKLESSVKEVPLLGHITYIAFLSASSGAAVYAVGRIFQEHYESGGTFISSHNRFLSTFFKEKYAEGKKLAPQYVSESKQAAV